MANELTLPAVFDKDQLPSLFGKTEDGKPSIETIVEKIETDAKSIVFDIETKEGQATCRSLASKIARAKTALDKAGKAKKDDYTIFTKAIDSDRKFAKDRLQVLQDEVRKPLTELEEREKARKANHEANLAELLVNDQGLNSENLQFEITKLEALAVGDDWEEYKEQALSTKDSELQRLRPIYQDIKQREEEQAELERLRAEKAENERIERERQIAIQAKAEAEAKAKREREEMEAKAERESQQAEQKQREAKEREARLIAEKKAIALKARQDKQRAIEQERQRVEAEKAKAEQERKQREANKKHRDTILLNARDDLVNNGIDEEVASEVIKLIYKNKVKNVAISF